MEKLSVEEKVACKENSLLVGGNAVSDVPSAVTDGWFHPLPLDVARSISPSPSPEKMVPPPGGLVASSAKPVWSPNRSLSPIIRSPSSVNSKSVNIGCGSPISLVPSPNNTFQENPPQFATHGSQSAGPKQVVIEAMPKPHPLS